MAKYLYRSCPKCGDYLGVVIPEPPKPVEEIPIDATCQRCGYRLELRVIVGRGFGRNEHDGLLPHVIEPI